MIREKIFLFVLLFAVIAVGFIVRPQVLDSSANQLSRVASQAVEEISF